MFVRTENGQIVKVTEDMTIKENEFSEKVLVYKKAPYVCVLSNKNTSLTQIVKQAETIEELCDCFVAVDKNGNLCEDPMIAKGHCFKSFCNYYKAKKIDVDCYLAILTNKGLIFVAKMNNKGELELL